MSITTPKSQNADHVRDLLATYGKGHSWEEVKPIFEGYYDSDVKYDIGRTGEDGTPTCLGFEQLVGFGRKAIEADARFEVDKIEETEEGIYSAGWMHFPGRWTEGNNYVQCLSKFGDNGKCIFIKNVNEDTDKRVQEVLERAGDV